MRAKYAGRFNPGDKVEKVIGVRLRGTVLRSIPLDGWTDGTYRLPLSLREWCEAVPVEWTDGTRGWTHAANVRHENAQENFSA